MATEVTFKMLNEIFKIKALPGNQYDLPHPGISNHLLGSVKNNAWQIH